MTPEACVPKSRGPELERLVASIARGDEGALTVLYDATSDWIHGLCLKILGDPGAAEEATLDAYMQVWKNAKTYEPRRGSATAWLTILARSRALDRLRSVAARRRREEPFLNGFDAAARNANPDAATVAEEQNLRVLKAVSHLPAEQKAAIDLAFFQGLTHVEIAGHLGEPIGTVKTRIRLGMMKLRSLLKPFEDLS